jgi:hypothetical protein
LVLGIKKKPKRENREKGPRKKKGNGSPKERKKRKKRKKEKKKKRKKKKKKRKKETEPKNKKEKKEKRKKEKRKMGGEVCAIEIGEMSRASLDAFRTRIVDAASKGKPLLFDLRNARPSCVQYTPRLAAIIRDDAHTLAASKRVGIVAKDEWVRAALLAALALAPSVAEYIVTDTYESAHAFCVAR